MSDPKIHVARGESALGVMSLSEVRALLAAGLFQPTDLFWTAGQADWQPLSQLPPAATPGATATSGIRDSLLSATTFFKRTAESAVNAVTSTVGAQRENLIAAREHVLEDYVPKLQGTVNRVLAESSRSVDSALRDDVFLRKLFGAVYDLLPRPVCRFVGEEDFIQFCFKHRQRLLRTTAERPATAE